MEFENKVFVVTGGANGIGKELVLQLLELKSKVVALDIDEKGLKNLAEETKGYSDFLATKVIDLTNKEEVEKLPQFVLEKFKKVDALLNVAGIVQPFVKFADLNYEQIDMVFNVNFFGLLYITKAFLPHFIKNDSKSYIANVSSMGGFLPVPGQTIYGASKAAVKLFSEGLYAEFKGTNIGVSTILPGGVKTEILRNSKVEGVSLMNGESQYKMTSASDAAKIILKGIKKEKFRIIVGRDSKTMNFLYKISSKGAVDMITEQMKKLVK